MLGGALAWPVSAVKGTQAGDLAGFCKKTVKSWMSTAVRLVRNSVSHDHDRMHRA